MLGKVVEVVTPEELLAELSEARAHFEGEGHVYVVHTTIPKETVELHYRTRFDKRIFRSHNPELWRPFNHKWTEIARVDDYTQVRCMMGVEKAVKLITKEFGLKDPYEVKLDRKFCHVGKVS